MAEPEPEPEPNNTIDTTPINPRSLDEFPDHLILYIISFLPTLHAVRTSSVSRKWRNLWTSLSSLNFDYTLFSPTAADNTSTTRHRFSDFVNQTLLRRPHSPLHQFQFQFNFADLSHRSQIDSWIHYAVKHDVVLLDIDFYIDRFYHNNEDIQVNYDFNFATLMNSKIRGLNLCRCDLILPYGMSNENFKSITSMYLDQIYLTDDMVADLIWGCVNLECLVLEYCYGMEKLNIVSNKLKELSLLCFHTQSEEDECLEICTPNLQSITIELWEMGNYSMKNAASLVEAKVEFLHRQQHFKYWDKVVRMFDGVEHLNVQNWWFKFLAQKDVKKKFALNMLTWLDLRTGYTQYDLFGLVALLEICPNLHTMVLHYLYKIDEDPSLMPESEWDELLNRPMKLNMPRLKQVKLNDFGGTENEVKFLKLLQRQEGVLEKIVIVPPQVGQPILPPVVLRKRVRAVAQQPSPPPQVVEN